MATLSLVMVAVSTMLAWRCRLNMVLWHWPCMLHRLCLAGMDTLPSSSSSCRGICHRHGLIVPASSLLLSSPSSLSHHGLCPAVIVVVVAVAVVMQGQGQGQVASSYRHRVGGGVVIVDWHGCVGICCRLCRAGTETSMLMCRHGIGHACCAVVVVVFTVLAQKRRCVARHWLYALHSQSHDC